MSIKYEKLTVVQLRAKAKAKGCIGYSKLKKEEIIVWLRTKCPKKRKSPSASPSASPSWNIRVEKPNRGVKLQDLTVEQLRQKAKEKRCIGYRKMKKEDLINEIRNGCTKIKNVKPGRVKLENVRVEELRAKVKMKGCKGYSKMKKDELISELTGGCTEKKKAPNNEYSKNSVSELRYKVQRQGCSGYSKMNKAQLIQELKKGCSKNLN